MLKKLLNECELDVTIETQGPILIKSGTATVSGPDMAFVQTYRNNRFEPYLPGSSLKGVLRSHAERIVNSLNDGVACMPFETNQNNQYFSCCKRLGEINDLSSQRAYKDSCPICKLFGSTSFIGRFIISDAYTTRSTKETRDGVGIDRFTGGSFHGAKFNLEVVKDAEFTSHIYLRNFETWQLGLLGALLKDLRDSYIYIGSGKSRGLGKVTAHWRNFSINYIGNRLPQQNTIPGIGALVGDDARKYGLTGDDIINIEGESLEVRQDGIRQRLLLNDDNFQRVMDKAIQKFFEYISGRTPVGARN